MTYEFTTCASANCSACAEIRRLRAETKHAARVVNVIDTVNDDLDDEVKQLRAHVARCPGIASEPSASDDLREQIADAAHGVILDSEKGEPLSGGISDAVMDVLRRNGMIR